MSDRTFNRFSLSRACIFSLCGHLCCFGLFSFGVGRGQALPQNPMIYGGRVLTSGQQPAAGDAGAVAAMRILSVAQQVKIVSPAAQPAYPWVKPAPQAVLALAKSLPPAMPVAGPKPSFKEPVLLLHPELPAQLQLYFKDRQEVHIELLFNIRPARDNSIIEVKRSVSSGNLQADLLSRRYISHYLFIQSGRFEPGKWLPVKVDLSLASHDRH